MDDLYAFRPPVQPSFSSAGEIESALNRFHAEYSRPVAMKLIALGYGPLGDKDSNFNPTFRRRYYLTEEALKAEFDYLCKHYEDIFDDEVKERLDTFFLDARWFLKNREDIHSGSVPSTERRRS